MDYLASSKRAMAGTTALGCLLKNQHPDPHSVHPLRICQNQCNTLQPTKTVEVSPILDHIVKELVMPSGAHDKLTLYELLTFQNKSAEAAAVMDAAVMAIPPPAEVLGYLTTWADAVGMRSEAARFVAAPWIAKYWKVLWRGNPPAEKPNTPVEITEFLFATIDALEPFEAARTVFGVELGAALPLVFPLRVGGPNPEINMYFTDDAWIQKAFGGEAKTMMHAIYGKTLLQKRRYERSVHLCTTFIPGTTTVEAFEDRHVWPHADPATMLAYFRWNECQEEADGLSLYKCATALKDDPLIAEMAGPFEFRHASDRLQSDPNIVAATFLSLDGSRWNTDIRPWTWHHASVAANAELPPPRILNAKCDYRHLKKHALPFMKEHDDFARKMIEANAKLYRYASDAVKNDPDVVLNMASHFSVPANTRKLQPEEWVRRYGKYITMIPLHLSMMPSFCTEVIKRDHHFFLVIPPHLKRNEVVVAEFVQANLKVIGHVIIEGLLTAHVFMAFYTIFVKAYKTDQRQVASRPWNAATNALRYNRRNAAGDSLAYYGGGEGIQQVMRPLFSTPLLAIEMMKLAVDPIEVLQMAAAFKPSVRNSKEVAAFIDEFSA